MKKTKIVKYKIKSLQEIKNKKDVSELLDIIKQQEKTIKELRKNIVSSIEPCGKQFAVRMKIGKTNLHLGLYNNIKIAKGCRLLAEGIRLTYTEHLHHIISEEGGVFDEEFQNTLTVVLIKKVKDHCLRYKNILEHLD